MIEPVEDLGIGGVLNNEEERKQVIKLFNSGTWYDTLGSLKHLYYERTPQRLKNV